MISGTAQGDRHAWDTTLAELRPSIGQLAPFIDAAFIRYAADLAVTGGYAYCDRHRPPSKPGRYLDPGQQRELEHQGLVADVEGILFVRNPLPSLPPGWRPHPVNERLTEIRADDLHAWFADYPTIDTLAKAREDLHSLLGS